MTGNELDVRRDAQPTLWVDADGAPREVIEIVQRAAARIHRRAILVANRRIDTPPGNPWVEAVRVAGGPDVADRWIVDNARAGDLAVTADLPLAAELVRRSVTTIDPRGDEYDEESIGERLSVRNYMDGLRGAGVQTGGARPFGQRDRQAFAAALDRAVTRLMRG